jgi:1,4-alpha-glucan branching enzyme
MNRKKEQDGPKKKSAVVKPQAPRRGTKTQRMTVSSKRANEPVVPTSPTEFSTLSDLDLHLFGEGKHEHIYEKLGAHVLNLNGTLGVAFAVWAPNAKSVSVVGNFNDWNGAKHQMHSLGTSGVWELFIPDLKEGELYKYEIKSGRQTFLKADPYALMMEVPPNTSSIVFKSKHKFGDRAWLTQRAKRQAWREPLSIYEVHFGSWRRITEEGNRPLTYREAAPLLADYALQNGFTHVEFLPLKEHPYGPSWG